MTKKKKITVAISAAVIALLAVATVSFAWFKSSDEVKNTFTTANVDVQLQELEWLPENGEQLRIGDTISKNPTVTANDGDIYCAVTMSIKDKDGKEITDSKVLSYINDFMYYDPDDKLEEGKSYTTEELEALGLSHYNPEFTREGDKFYLKSNGKYTTLKDGSSKELFTNIVVPCDITKKDFTTVMSPLENYSISFVVNAVLADSFSDFDDPNNEINKVLK